MPLKLITYVYKNVYGVFVILITIVSCYISYVCRVVAQLCDSIDALMNIDLTSSTSGADTGGTIMTISNGQSHPETVTMMHVDDPQAGGGDSSSSNISKFVVLIAATNK